MELEIKKLAQVEYYRLRESGLDHATALAAVVDWILFVTCVTDTP